MFEPIVFEPMFVLEPMFEPMVADQFVLEPVVAEQFVLEPMIDHFFASYHVDFVFDQSSFAQTCPLPNTNFPIVNHVSACVF
jgi:hypothetical protein